MANGSLSLASAFIDEEGEPVKKHVKAAKDHMSNGSLSSASAFCKEKGEPGQKREKAACPHKHDSCDAELDGVEFADR